MAPKQVGIKQQKRIIYPSTSMWFLLFNSPLASELSLNFNISKMALWIKLDFEILTFQRVQGVGRGGGGPKWHITSEPKSWIRLECYQRAGSTCEISILQVYWPSWGQFLKISSPYGRHSFPIILAFDIFCLFVSVTFLRGNWLILKGEITHWSPLKGMDLASYGGHATIYKIVSL